MKKNIIITILSALVVGLGVYIICDKFNNNSNKINDSKQGQEDVLKLGLDLYKFATGNGSGPEFVWDDSTKKYTNYQEVLSKFTKEVLDKNDMGFSIPVFENGEWKSFGGYGTSNISYFKDISIQEKSDNLVTFKITYEYKTLDDKSDNFKEATQFFRIKKVNNEWKIDDFELIYGLKFDKN